MYVCLFTSDCRVVILCSDLLQDSDPELLNDLASQVHVILNAPMSSSTTGTSGDFNLMPLTSSDNVSFLVEIRCHHQTKEAEKGICRKGMVPSEAPSGEISHLPHTSGGPVSECRLLAHKIHEIVKEVNGTEDVATSTGLNWKVQWTKTPGLYTPSSTHLDSLTNSKSGNSANAKEVTLKAANAVCFSLTCRVVLI